MATKFKIEEIGLIESDIEIASNLVNHLYGEICEQAPLSSDLDKNSEAYRTREYYWCSRADFIHAMTKGVVLMLDEIKQEVHDIVEDVYNR